MAQRACRRERRTRACAAAASVTRAAAGAAAGADDVAGTHCVVTAAAVAAAAFAAAASRGQQLSTTTCTNTSWMFVAGFTGTSTWLNGFYVPYYSASQAPSDPSSSNTLTSCTNSNYGGLSSSIFNSSWQSAGRPVGYYNMQSSVSDSSNSFWVRDLEGSQSYWNLVLGTANCPTVTTNYYVYMSAPGPSAPGLTVSGECACALRPLLSSAVFFL